MNRLRSRNLISFSRSVVMSKITHLLYVKSFDSHLLISITLRSASTSPTPLWIAVLPPALLWIVVLPPQNDILLPYILLHCLCFHKVLFHNFVILRFFNEHRIYWSGFWSCLFPCMTTSFTLAQKLNYICSSHIYIMNYHLHKFYLLIICLAFCTFQRWWWMQQQPYNQWLNIQHTSCFILLNSFYAYVHFNNFASSSCLHLCSLLCASFSFVILCSFSITLFTLMLLWTRTSKTLTTCNNKQKQLSTITMFFSSLNFMLVAFILTYLPSFN